MQYERQIVIVGTILPPAAMADLLRCLQGGGHDCAVMETFDGTRLSTNKTTSALVVLGSSGLDHLQVRETIRRARSSYDDVLIVVVLDGSGHDATDALLDSQVDDFLVAPVNPQDARLRIERLAKRAANARGREFQRTNHTLLSHFAKRQFVGEAPAFRAVVDKIPSVASCDATVLLTGETGTGKEMCARAIHYVSRRANGPFIAVDCGSIPTELFENELFGHEPGAFTDARRSRGGLIAQAQSGTLLIDEVDSLAPSAQAKLLRLLQERQYKPLGAPQYRRADIRIIAATNQDLRRKVREGTFREDLYYRLMVLSLSLPPLRERHEDVLPLASHFLEIAGREYDRIGCRFSDDALRKLTSYSWPGNIRELENVVRQAVVLAKGPVIRGNEIALADDCLPTFDSEPQSFKLAKARVVEAFERSYLRDALAACNGNISRAASQAQKNRRAFFGLLKKHGLTQAPRRRAR